jgi:hypothetical protein
VSCDQLVAVGGRQSDDAVSVDTQVPPLRSITEERLDVS